MLRLSILFLIILSGCTTRMDPGDRYLRKISQRMEKYYSIKHGELVAKYDLIPKPKVQNRCLFAQDFGVTVGDESHSEKFLQLVEARSPHLEYLPSYAENKARAIYQRLYEINSKFKFLHSGELVKIGNFKKSSSSVFDVISSESNKRVRHNALEHLLRADTTIKQVPVFLPQTHNAITSNFGYRKHPISRKKTMHYGTDFASNKHSMIYAAAEGKVVEVAQSKSYGTFILIEHALGFKTRYAHLSKLHVRTGERIFQGQLIGRQGKTGCATKDHLHFEILYKNIPVNPMIFVGKEYHCRRP